MSLRIAIVYGDKDVFVEFREDVFRELLKMYLKKNKGDIDVTMDQIISELKKKTLYT
jgi:hypothetical protein